VSDRLIHRREFLAGGASLAAALALGGAGPKLLRYRGAVPLKSTLERPALDSANYSAIKHVVFLMQENRSFDHYFGVLEGVNGFFPTSGAGGALSGSSTFYQDWPDGSASTLQPFHLDTTTGIAECTDDLSHLWQAEHSSWNNGAMDSFVSTHTSDTYEGPDFGTLTMGYYSNLDIPYYYALAQAFTICDNYFCSVLGPTHPNRLMQMTGMLDPNGVAGGPILVTNSENQYTGSCSWTTMPEILEDAGISWKVYNPYGPLYMPNGSGLSMDLCMNPLFYMEQFTSDPSSTLYDKAFNYNGISIPTSKRVYNGLTSPKAPNHFLSDIQSNSLPQVSWIIPPDGYDEHPPAPATLGEWFTSQVVKALQSNKDVWESTVLFIMYDENDGFFDHVAPPTAASGTPGEYVTVSQSNPVNGAQPADTSYAVDQPIGLGVRVPMLVVSPFSQGGYVCSDVFDHTSQLQFLGAIFGVDATVGGNVSSWRQSTVGDLTSTLTNFPLPTKHGSAVYPKTPKLPKTSDKDTVAPVASPLQCTGSDLDELGAPPDSWGPETFSNCTTTEGSNVVSAPLGSSFTEIDGFPTGMIPGLTVIGPGIPPGTTVKKVTKGSSKVLSTVTLSQAATATAHGTATMTFIIAWPLYAIPPGQPLPIEVQSTLKSA